MATFCTACSSNSDDNNFGFGGYPGADYERAKQLTHWEIGLDPQPRLSAVYREPGHFHPFWVRGTAHVDYEK